MSNLVVREYGFGLDTLIVAHGGPAAAGDLAPLARTLCEQWRVLDFSTRSHGPIMVCVPWPTGRCHPWETLA